MRRDELSLADPPATDRPGDRWVCGRASDQAPCSRGPSVKGACPLADACRPQRTWYGRRKLIGNVAAVVLIATLFAMTGSKFSAAVFKPGDLATPHAQILAGVMTSQRCASCHPRAATNPREWFASRNDGHTDVSQIDRCLNCHHTTIDEATAKLAHNLTRRVRVKLRLAAVSSGEESWHDLLPGPAVSQDNLQCGACHREHRGAGGDLLAVSDSQCQTCHSDRFGSFAASHPDWDRWPYGRGGEISFSHSSHAVKHFPATVRGTGVAQFQCADCHRRTADNELTRSTSYQQACKSCHDEALRVESASGVELLALPTLPTEATAEIEVWPASATGFYDGKLSPIADLLMRSDPQTASAIRQLPMRDFSQIDRRMPRAVAAGQTIARAYRRLLQEIADGGQQVIIDRGTALGVAPSTLESFVQSLPPQLVAEANRSWFNTERTKQTASVPIALPHEEVRQAQFQDLSILPSSSLPAQGDDDLLSDADEADLLLAPDDSQILAADNDPLAGRSNDELLGGGDLLGIDPLNNVPLAIESHRHIDSPNRFNADNMMPQGGWFRDDLRFAIQYRGGGHEDLVLKSTIEWISQLPPSDPARQQLLKTPAVAACVTCHVGAVFSTGGWGSNPLIGRRSEFTKFRHSPHLNVAQLADCRHCHTMESGLSSQMNLISGIVDVRDFAPLGREACAACHTAQAAGDTCITCHRYHIDLR